MEKKTVGKFISALRKANGMTQRELGEKLFVSDKTVSRWECDECTPDLSLIPIIAEIFGITTDELLRGERSNQERQAVTVDILSKQKAKSSKRFNLMLHNRTKRFTNLSFISIGLIIAGFIAAMICNLGFSRGLLGFCLASIFFVAATICQLCFTVSFRLLIDDEEEHSEKIKKANTDMVFSSIRIFFSVLLTFAFCLPIATLTHNSYYGLAFDSWLLFGALFAVIAFLFAFCSYKLFIIKLLLKNEIVHLTETEINKNNTNNQLLKQCCKMFILVFSVLTIGLIIISIIDENNGFTKIVKFNDTDEFIEYVQNQYNEWYEETYEDVVINGPNSDENFSYPEHSNYWAVIDGKDYYYQPDLYYILNVHEYDDGNFDITIITNEAFYNARDTVDTLYTILIVLHVLNLFACSAWYCRATLKKKEKIKG